MRKKLFLLLCVAAALASCKKEYITNEYITNEYITNESVYTKKEIPLLSLHLLMQ